MTSLHNQPAEELDTRLRVKSYTTHGNEIDATINLIIVGINFHGFCKSAAIYDSENLDCLGRLHFVRCDSTNC